MHHSNPCSLILTFSGKQQFVDDYVPAATCAEALQACRIAMTGHLVTNNAAHLPCMLLQACQKLHWQLQWQLPGMTYAPVPAAVEGAGSTLQMQDAASPHPTPWDALVPDGALGIPSWKVPGKVGVMEADLPEKLGDLEQQLISQGIASRLQ